MTARLRIHRGYAPADAVVMLETGELGPLSGDVSEFDVPAGTHILSLKIGYLSGMPTRITVPPRTVLEMSVIDNPDAVLPMVQGGFVKFAPTDDPASPTLQLVPLEQSA